MRFTTVHGPAHGDDHQHSWFNGASAGLMRPPDSLRDLLIGSLKGACISSEDGCFWRVFGLLSAMCFDGFLMVFCGMSLVNFRMVFGHGFG